MQPTSLTVTPLEDRLTPADVVVNYVVFSTNAGLVPAFGTPGIVTVTPTAVANNAFNSTGLGIVGTSTGGTNVVGGTPLPTNRFTPGGSVITGNGLNTLNQFNTINGLTNPIAGPFAGTSGFALRNVNGITLDSQSNTNFATSTIGSTGPTLLDADAPTLAEITEARGTRTVMQSADGRTGLVVNPFPGYAGELRTAVADVTGDGIPDTVVAPGVGGGPRVAVFDGQTGSAVADFFAYDDALRNGVDVAAGDLTGNGRAAIVTGAGVGGGPRVRVFQIFGTQAVPTADFFAFDPDFRGGVTVAVGNLTGSPVNQILTGAGPGGGPRVDSFNAIGDRTGTVFLGDDRTRSGANIGGVLREGNTNLLLAAAPQVGLYNAVTGQLVRGIGAIVADPVNPPDVSFITPTEQPSRIRVSQDSLPDAFFDLNGVAVG